MFAAAAGLSSLEAGTGSRILCIDMGPEMDRTLLEPLLPSLPPFPLTRRLSTSRSAFSWASIVVLLRLNVLSFRASGMSDRRLSTDFDFLSVFRRAMSLKRFSKECLRAKTVQMDTQMELPSTIRSQSMICCQVVIWLRLTVFRPASVMAEMTRNKLSV